MSWKNAWKELAQQTGLTFFEERREFNFLKQPVLKGIYKGHPVKFDSFARAGGRGARFYTEIKILLKTPQSKKAFKIELAYFFKQFRNTLGKETPDGYLIVSRSK